MLDADVIVFHGLGFPGGGAQDLIRCLRDIDLVGVAAGAGHPGHGRELFSHSGGEAARVHIQLLEQLRNQALLLGGQCMEQVLRLHGVVLVLHRQLLGSLQCFQCLLGILIGIHRIDLHSYRKLVFK